MKSWIFSVMFILTELGAVVSGNFLADAAGILWHTILSMKGSARYSGDPEDNFIPIISVLIAADIFLISIAFVLQQFEKASSANSNT